MARKTFLLKQTIKQDLALNKLVKASGMSKTDYIKSAIRALSGNYPDDMPGKGKYERKAK